MDLSCLILNRLIDLNSHSLFLNVYFRSRIVYCTLNCAFSFKDDHKLLPKIVTNHQFNIWIKVALKMDVNLKYAWIILPSLNSGNWNVAYTFLFSFTSQRTCPTGQLTDSFNFLSYSASRLIRGKNIRL